MPRRRGGRHHRHYQSDAGVAARGAGSGRGRADGDRSLHNGFAVVFRPVLLLIVLFSCVFGIFVEFGEDGQQTRRRRACTRGRLR